MTHPRQLSLFEARSIPAPAPSAERPAVATVTVDAAERLRERVAPRVARRLAAVILTDNRSRILSLVPAGAGAWGLRINRAFSDAPEEVIDAVATLVDGERDRRRPALAAVRRYFDRVSTIPPRRRTLDPVGVALDLRQVRDRLNRDYFDQRLTAAITWGRALPVRRRRRARRLGGSIQLGSYDARGDLVRVHRALDHVEVPAFVVASVVFHELLHAALPAETCGGRRRLHGPAFRRRERAFPDHARAEAWITSHLDTLLRRARGG